MSWWSRPLAVLAFLLCSSASHADDMQTAAAIAAFDEARELRRQGNLAAACDRLQASYELDPQLGSLLHLADCREDNGQVATAWSLFRDAEELAARLSDPREEVAQRRATELEPRRSFILLRLPADLPPQVRVARNGVDIPPAFLSEALPVDVGSYLIEVSAPGYEHLSVEANVTAEGERREVTVPELTREQVAEEPPASPAAAGTVVEEASEAEAAAEPHPAQAREDRPGRRLRRDLGWVGIGVGAAGLLVGGIAGAVVLSEYGALGCGEGACAASPQEASRLNTLRVVSSVGLISGAAIGVAGITLLVTARRGETVVAVTPFVTGDSVGIRGWF